jgi:metal-responsive CopG/Arc/MetJ family transcriptional regulator
MRRLSVLLDDDEFASFEKYCDEQGHKKSTLVAKLIRDLLERERVVSQRQLFVSTEKPGRRSA